MLMRGIAGFALAVLFLLPVSASSDALININTSDAAMLQTLNGIGPSKAQAIVDYRNASGPFATIEEIKNVSGIGDATFNNIKDFITVGEDTQQQSDASAQEQQQTQAQSSQSDSQTQAQAYTAPVSSYVPPPTPTIFADAGGDRTVIVGADTRFDARAYGKDQSDLTGKVRFSWNFGDGSTAEGMSILHHFAYPGRYAVVLSIAEGMEAVSDRIAVAAEPAKLAFSSLPDGSVSIENHAGRDLDLSGWIVKQFGRYLVLPEHSIILAGERLRIAQPTLGFWANSDAELDYPNGIVALHSGESTEPAGDTSTSVSQLAPAPPTATAQVASAGASGMSSAPVAHSYAPPPSVD
ncbi:MAG: helix-hairpin-helix domain-containing protein, partial [Patescibacteria group bacterium]|nr:helix-hairpin-helix domain-containing protein [Patescibacteria group bacterium]